MTHDDLGRADQIDVKLFRRNDDAYAAAAAERDARPTQIKRPVSRLNTACAEMRETHTELDGIESRLTMLREHQAAFLAKAAATSGSAVDGTPGRVETVDLRSLVDVDLTSAHLDEAAKASEAPNAAETANVHASPEAAEAAEAHEAAKAFEADDFDRRFAAFAAGENDDSSRRWLDTA